MPYNIHYWWFFLSQGNQWRKYLVRLKLPKPRLLMLVSLVALDGFHLLLFTQLTADLTPEWSGGSMFHPLSHIYAKTPFCCIETVANNTMNHPYVFDRLQANAAPTLNTAFSLTNVHAKWWIHCLLISSISLLSHTTSIYDWPKQVCGVFGVFRYNCWIWVTWVFSIICVCTTVFRVSIPPCNHRFWWSRVQIILIKPLLYLNCIFPIRKQCFINTGISDFSIVLKICNTSLK